MTLTANFGDLGYTAGLFGGYGFQLNNLYFGGELEAELAKTHSDHERIGGGSPFRSKNNGAMEQVRVPAMSSTTRHCFMAVSASSKRASNSIMHPAIIVFLRNTPRPACALAAAWNFQRQTI